MNGELFLNRTSFINDKQITGRLFNEPLDFSVHTLERPDKANQNNISCIPSGFYNWVKVAATKKIPYTHISILNVKNRKGICIHAANFVYQIEGCIAVGESLADINSDGLLDVLRSKDTFNKIMAILPDNGTIKIY